MDTLSTVGAQVRLEERARFTGETTSYAVSAATPNGLKSFTQPMLESELAPQLRYDLLWQHGFSHFVALYAPRFVIPDTTNLGSLRFSSPTIEEVNEAQYQHERDESVRLPQQLGAFHNFALALELQRPRTHWGIYQFGGYGPISKTALVVQKPWTGEGLPASPYPVIPSIGPASFNLLFLQTNAYVNLALTRRVTLTPVFNFNAFGGADNLSRTNIPLTYGPGGRLVLDVKSTPRDTWRSTAGGGYTFPPEFVDRFGTPTTRVEVEERLIHQWRPLITSEAGVGAVVAINPLFGSRLYPAGEVNTIFGWDHRNMETRLAAVGRLGPWINILSGDVEQKAEGVVALNHRIDKTTLRAQASLAGLVGNTDVISKYRLATGQVSLAYRITRILTVDAGVRASTQFYARALRRDDTHQLMVFGGLTLATEQPLRF